MDTTCCLLVKPAYKPLAIALGERGLTVTEDKDFGESVFLRAVGFSSRYCALSGMTPVERVDAMPKLIEHHAQALRERAVIEVSGKRVRVRFAQDSNRS